MSEAAGTTSSFSECYQTGAVLSYRTYREVELPGTTPFLFVNHDLTQVIVEKPWFSIALGPFIDAGVVSDGPEGLGSKGMVVDVGLQTELRVMTGFALRLSYGRDLRDGNHVFYASYAP